MGGWFGFRLLSVFGGLLDFVLGCLVAMLVLGFGFVGHGFLVLGVFSGGYFFPVLGIGLVYSGWLCVTWAGWL